MKITRRIDVLVYNKILTLFSIIAVSTMLTVNLELGVAILFTSAHFLLSLLYFFQPEIHNWILWHNSKIF